MVERSVQVAQHRLTDCASEQRSHRLPNPWPAHNLLDDTGRVTPTKWPIGSIWKPPATEYLNRFPCVSWGGRVAWASVQG